MTTPQSSPPGPPSNANSPGSTAAEPGRPETCCARRSSTTSRASTTPPASSSGSDTVHQQSSNKRQSPKHRVRQTGPRPELEAMGLDRVRTEVSVQYVDHNLLQAGSL